MFRLFRKKPKMPHDWDLVMHFWFVDSLGWKHRKLYDMTEDEAEREATMWEKQEGSTFKHCSTYLIKNEPVQQSADPYLQTR